MSPNGGKSSKARETRPRLGTRNRIGVGAPVKMTRLMQLFLIAGLLFVGGTVLAQDPQPKPLTGDFYVGPGVEAQTDGDAAAPKDHFFVTLTGDSAKAMYEALSSEEVQDECVGRIAKWANGLVCYGPKTSDGSVPDPLYECYFSINLKNQSLELGGDC